MTAPNLNGSVSCGAFGGTGVPVYPQTPTIESTQQLISYNNICFLSRTLLRAQLAPVPQNPWVLPETGIEFPVNRLCVAMKAHAYQFAWQVVTCIVTDNLASWQHTESCHSSPASLLAFLCVTNTSITSLAPGHWCSTKQSCRTFDKGVCTLPPR